MTDRQWRTLRDAAEETARRRRAAFDAWMDTKPGTEESAAAARQWEAARAEDSKAFRAYTDSYRQEVTS